MFRSLYLRLTWALVITSSHRSKGEVSIFVCEWSGCGDFVSWSFPLVHLTVDGSEGQRMSRVGADGPEVPVAVEDAAVGASGQGAGGGWRRGAGTRWDRSFQEGVGV